MEMQILRSFEWFYFSNESELGINFWSVWGRKWFQTKQVHEAHEGFSFKKMSGVLAKNEYKPLKDLSQPRIGCSRNLFGLHFRANQMANC